MPILSAESASDFELWVRFFRHARLYSVEALIGGFRLHADSDSSSAIEKYHGICEEIVERELASTRGATSIKLFRAISHAFKLSRGGSLWQRLAINGLYRIPGPVSRWSSNIAMVMFFRQG